MKFKHLWLISKESNMLKPCWDNNVKTLNISNPFNICFFNIQKNRKMWPLKFVELFFSENKYSKLNFLLFCLLHRMSTNQGNNCQSICCLWNSGLPIIFRYCSELKLPKKRWFEKLRNKSHSVDKKKCKINSWSKQITIQDGESE